MGKLGDYEKRNEAIERGFKEVVTDGDETVTQWTNAAFRCGYKEGVKDTSVVALAGVVAALIVGAGTVALQFVGPKFKKFVNDKFRKK